MKTTLIVLLLALGTAVALAGPDKPAKPNKVEAAIVKTDKPPKPDKPDHGHGKPDHYACPRPQKHP